MSDDDELDDDLPNPKELADMIGTTCEVMSLAAIIGGFVHWSCVVLSVVLLAFAQLMRRQGRNWERQHKASQRGSQ